MTAIWLMPFQPSPGRDGGYDVADYYGVDPTYGTLGDFVEFTHGCKQRGIRVLIDLVVNHTSDEHPWFREARSSPDSKYRDWYVWSKKKPKNAAEGVVFPGVQKSTWTYDERRESYYFHRFYDFQPDLNTVQSRCAGGDPEDHGLLDSVGSFRISHGCRSLCDRRERPNSLQSKEQYDMLREFREFLSWREGDAIVLAEANVLPDTDLEYFGRPANGCR